MRRWRARDERFAVLALGVGLMITTAACTSTSEDEGRATTSTTTTTITAAASLDGAVASWVAADGSLKYLGLCPADFDPDYPLDGICSVPLSVSDDRSVQGLGPPFSEITAYLLLERRDDGWSVIDAYSPASPYDLTDAPDWVPTDRERTPSP